MISYYTNKMLNCRDVLFSCFLEVLFLRLTFQIGIKLYGEKVVKRYNFIHLNCTTESMPIENSIEIHANQESFTIRLLQEKCFSSAIGGQCAPKFCQCSPRGLWYSHIYQADQSQGQLEVTCSMLFRSTGILSDSIKVKIVDFSGPKIRTDVGFPVHSGTAVQFICDLEGSNKDITFVWECANKETSLSGKEKNREYSSIINRTVYLQHDNTNCTCTVNVNGYVATYAIQIYISKNPIVYSNESMYCNNTSQIEISCTMSTELPVYGFGMWTHSIHGTALRYLRGKIKDNQSILMLTNCSYQDAGDYECVAWTLFEGKTYNTNKLISLYVNSPPVIVSANKLRQTQNIILTVRFCSSVTPTALWSVDRSIVNSAVITKSLRNRTIPLQIYNETINCEGYIANLSINSGKGGVYVLRLQNDFGDTRQEFSVAVFQAKGLTNAFDFRFVLIGITVVGIFILIITVTVVLIRGRSSNIVHIVGPHELSSIPIYHSAPSSEPVIHIYDDALPGYLEVIDSQSENEDKESDETSTNTLRNAHIYEDIDHVD